MELQTIKAERITYKDEYTPTKAEVLERQNAELVKTIAELQNKGLSIIREKVEYKLAKNVTNVINALGLTQKEKAFLAKQTCFLDEKENDKSNKTLDVNCLIWALLNVRENLVEMFGELLAEKFFDNSLDLDNDILEKAIKKVLR